MEIFDKDRLTTLIEKVIVYGEDAVEIVWKVKNPFDSEKHCLKDSSNLGEVVVKLSHGQVVLVAQKLCF